MVVACCKQQGMALGNKHVSITQTTQPPEYQEGRTLNDKRAFRPPASRL